MGGNRVLSSGVSDDLGSWRCHPTSSSSYAGAEHRQEGVGRRGKERGRRREKDREEHGGEVKKMVKKRNGVEINSCMLFMLP